ncbi:MAG: hypothetical protein IJV31_04625 [Clostridia bacterium]|nr:hypothetical protein [Clostridia bacterium]
MGIDISLEQIKKYKNEYNKNPENKLIEKAIVKEGLKKACLNKNVIEENKMEFNIELPDAKKLDQKGSFRCWMFGGINMIKRNVADNLNIDYKDIDLSTNYIAFFDRFEKSNTIYENIIKLENIEQEYILSERIVERGVKETGYYEWFASIVNKYGIIPNEYYPNSFESDEVETTTIIVAEKIKKDVSKLIQAKKAGKTTEELRNQKEQFLQENFELLCKIYGEPVTEFDFEYTDKTGQKHTYHNMTPLKFKNKFLTIDLDEFVSVADYDMFNKTYNNVYSVKYEENVYGKSSPFFLNIPITEIKELVIKQLKDGIPVFFGALEKKYTNYEFGVFDKRVYSYDKMLGLESLTRREAYDFGELCFSHVMSFTGVQVENGKSVRWKIEDSYKMDYPKNGTYVMNDNFFDEFVVIVAVNKKYLSNEQLELLNKPKIKTPVEDVY